MRKQKAILLDDVGLSVEGKKITRILDFFGAPWRALATTEFLTHNGAAKDMASMIGGAKSLLG